MIFSNTLAMKPKYSLPKKTSGVPHVTHHPLLLLHCSCYLCAPTAPHSQVHIYGAETSLLYIAVRLGLPTPEAAITIVLKRSFYSCSYKGRLRC